MSRNKLTYGVYTYIEHDLDRKAFKIHYKPTVLTKQQEARSIPISDCATLSSAQEFAKQWVVEKNKLSYSKYILLDVAVMLDKRDNRMKYHFMVKQGCNTPPKVQAS